MIFALLNLIVIVFLLVWAEEKFKLNKHLPKNSLIKFSCQLIGSILVLALSGLLTFIYPDNWVKSNSSDDSIEREQCYDKQGSYDC